MAMRATFSERALILNLPRETKEKRVAFITAVCLRKPTSSASSPRRMQLAAKSHQSF